MTCSDDKQANGDGHMMAVGPGLVPGFTVTHRSPSECLGDQPTLGWLWGTLPYGQKVRRLQEHGTLVQGLQDSELEDLTTSNLPGTLGQNQKYEH